MAGWREDIIDGWQERRDLGIFGSPAKISQATRVFFEESGAAGSLPDLGDKYVDINGANVDGLYMRDLVLTGYSTDTGGVLRKAIATYKKGYFGQGYGYGAQPAPETTGGSPITSSTPFSHMPVWASANSKMVQLPVGDGHVWKGTSDPVQTPMGKRIVNWTVEIPRVFDDHDAIAPLVSQGIGKVNNTTFLGAGSGHVLFSGYEEAEFLDEGGTVHWNATLMFEIQYIPIGGGVGNWQYHYNPDSGDFAEVDPPVYQDADFETLLW